MTGLERSIRRLLALVVLAGACGGGAVEAPPPAVLTLGGSQVGLVADVVGDVELVEPFSSGIRIRVVDVVWRLDEAILAGGVPFEVPDLKAGDELDVVVRGAVEPSGRTLVFLGTFAWSDTVAYADPPWFLDLAADPSSGMPVKGTDTATVDALDSALLGPGETDRIAALIDLVAESAAILRAQNLGEAKPFTPRADRVQAALLGERPISERSPLDGA